MTHIIGSTPEPANDEPFAIVKLIGGEQVIGRMVKVDDVSIDLRDPRTLAITGPGQLALAPFMFATDSVVPIFKAAVVSVGAQVPQNLIDAHIQATTGIQLARGLPQ